MPDTEHGYAPRGGAFAGVRTFGEQLEHLAAANWQLAPRCWASTRQAQRTRLGSIVDALAHSSDHYGQIVEYLRASSIVPPASRSAGQRGRRLAPFLTVGYSNQKTAGLRSAPPM